MNGDFARALRRQLMPALERHQGFDGTYSRAGSNRPLRVIPTKPDWLSEIQQGAEILLWKGLVFEVSNQAWAETGFGEPQHGDRLQVTLADGVQQIYELLPPKGKRPYEQDAVSASYFLHMKLVSA